MILGLKLALACLSLQGWFVPYTALFKIMEDIVDHLKLSIEDDFLSKAEKKSLKEIIGNRPLDDHQRSFLRSKIYELANEKITSN
ncbi:MAG: hypothetical protein IPJ20_14710 [Flammeovirgaceae bacterium]|nr:hypothetical protein [Flammeovirgaceae bacterium]